MKKVFYLVLCLSLVLVSCSKDDVDPRDAYVGSWTANVTGSMNFSFSGATTTFPTVGTANATVAKVGTDKLDIGGLEATLSGSKLIIDPTTETETANGVTSQLTSTYSGTASGGLMVITIKYSGTATSGTNTGVISGTTVNTFTKK